MQLIYILKYLLLYIIMMYRFRLQRCIFRDVIRSKQPEGIWVEKKKNMEIVQCSSPLASEDSNSLVLWKSECP